MILKYKKTKTFLRYHCAKSKGGEEVSLDDMLQKCALLVRIMRVKTPRQGNVWYPTELANRSVMLNRITEGEGFLK